MKLEVLLSLLLLVTASVLGADPIDLQWRTPLALEEGESGEVRCSTKDSAGNVLVGWALGGPTYSKGVVSKLDASGNEVWQFSLPDYTGFAIRSLGTDTSGNVYFLTSTANVSAAYTQQLMVVKLSAAGQELWRCPLGEDALYGDFHNCLISSSGTVWVSHYRTLEPTGQRIAVKRISNGGEIDWSVEWDVVRLLSSSYYPGQLLQVDESENVYLAWPSYDQPEPGSSVTKSYLRKLDSEGTLVWEKTVTSFVVLDTVLGPVGDVAVSGSGGIAFFDSAGEPVSRIGGSGDYCRIKDYLANGQLFTSWSSQAVAGAFFQLSGPDMQPLWRVPIGSQYSTRIVKNPAGGWVVGGIRVAAEAPHVASTVAIALAVDGTRRWLLESDSIFQSNAQNYVSLGLWFEVLGDRLCLFGTEAQSYFAYSPVAAQVAFPTTLPPSLFDSSPSGGIWQKGETFSMSVAPAGPGPFTYRWYLLRDTFRQGELVPDQTGPTLQLSAAQFPAAHGYYYAEITSGDVTTASPLALVDLDGIHLESLGLNEDGYQRIRISTPVGTAFGLESSTDLIDWVPGYVSTNFFETTELITINSPARFFRAVKAE